MKYLIGFGILAAILMAMIRELFKANEHAKLYEHEHDVQHGNNYDRASTYLPDDDDEERDFLENEEEDEQL
jgi:phosphopantothenoylcysteine synthetase/decarboxylase